MQSLRTQLITPFILGTIALALLLAWYTYTSAITSVKDAAFLISEAKTKQITGALDMLFKSLEASMQGIANNRHIQNLFTEKGDTNSQFLATSAEWVETLTTFSENYRDITVLDNNGTCIVSSNPGKIGHSYAHVSYVERALGGLYSTANVMIGRVSKQLSAMGVCPIDIGGGIVGVLVVTYDFPQVVEYKTKVNTDNHIIASMIDASGLFVTHEDDNIMGNRDEVRPALYAQLIRTGVQGNSVEYEAFGKSYIGYAAFEPTSEWIIISSGLKNEVLAPAYQIGITVVCISLFFLSVISIIVLRFANGILKSLFELVDYARKISEGQLHLKPSGIMRNDELGTLRSALRRMVNSLRKMLILEEEANKMKGQFLANMSHEIRTPLNAIIGLAHLSLQHSSLDNKTKDFLEKIHTAARSLLGLINDILDLSKVEAGKLALEQTVFDLRRTMNDAVIIHQQAAASKGLYLTLNYAEDAPTLFVGDALRIGQVLNNLISNALKFTSEGGISLTCERGSPPDYIPDCIPTHGEDGNKTIIMNLAVKDTGIGMTSKIIKKLFQPFTQADASISRKFGGTGLGLSISKKIVELFHGEFKVTSEPGHGTTFAFTLYLSPYKEESASANAGITDDDFSSCNLRGRVILIAEDNAVNQLIMEELLQPTGATIILVENGEEAVNAAHNKNLDLILMDMQMPIMDGLTATKAIREFLSAEQLPIVAVTANAFDDDKKKGFACGMNDYMTKPIEPDVLLLALRRWLTPSNHPT